LEHRLQPVIFVVARIAAINSGGASSCSSFGMTAARRPAAVSA
jgi:hypothetical protein